MKTSYKAKLPSPAIQRKERKGNTANEPIFRIQLLRHYYTKLLLLDRMARNYRFS